ncbi:3-isopropylmalate dehydratase large subunit [Pseudomonas sp. GD03817]|nr:MULTISPECIES: 3-isopropylmalate dehydratase large subunit [Pseudomonas]MCE0962210.1 3-isopropylmalate dehydratase large subunit [Pseudomonas putida]MDH1400685.1 3-isopropylmalate dehydratase large subunit [Pseudomonas sp. GD03730]MDH1774551.1 3-isopropylmalate dehydratase large subunit [Pseudomonas sp. GD03817]MDT3746146.1 3-isopropylmalate dehydratase large subunit [Pseudomonas kurunegalensis]
MMPKTLLHKLWNAHTVREGPAGSAVLYIDRHLVNEVTSPQAFEGLSVAGRRPWRGDTVIATSDHNVPTRELEMGIRDPLARTQVQTLERNCETFGLKQYRLGEHGQGILHVTGPELGATLPGMTIVCGDSHTSTHGAFAALAFGIGTSEIEQVLATQCLLVSRMATMNIQIEGTLPWRVTAKDLALFIIRKIGAAGATGYAIEFSGSTVRGMSMEARMTLCNMAIEAGARVGLIGVDEITLTYLHGRSYAPKGEAWDAACLYWRGLRSDEGAIFDKTLRLDAREITAQVSWGTSPQMTCDVTGQIPDPLDEPDMSIRQAMVHALEYMGLQGGTQIQAVELDKIFIGSCTNARLEDLRAAARIVEGRKISKRIRQALVVPGSQAVKAMAEAEGLDKVFSDAGFEWREPGCSMCLGMNEDRLLPGERCASTSNRNFEGRQGQGGRTHLVSPVTAAAAALAGHFVDPRTL